MQSLILLTVLQIGAVPPEPAVRTKSADLLDTWTFVSVEWLGERTEQFWEYADPEERDKWGNRVWSKKRVEVTFEKNRFLWFGDDRPKGCFWSPNPRILDYQIEWKQGDGVLLINEGRYPLLIRISGDTMLWCYDARNVLPKKVASDVNDDNIYLLIFRRAKS
jgi:hypothetical protein